MLVEMVDTVFSKKKFWLLRTQVFGFIGSILLGETLSSSPQMRILFSTSFSRHLALI